MQWENKEPAFPPWSQGKCRWWPMSLKFSVHSASRRAHTTPISIAKPSQGLSSHKCISLVKTETGTGCKNEKGKRISLSAHPYLVDTWLRACVSLSFTVSLPTSSLSPSFKVSLPTPPLLPLPSLTRVFSHPSFNANI